MPEARLRQGDGGTFVRRLGGAVGRDVHEDVWMGIGRPFGLDECDDVLLAIDLEEGFCG